MNSALREIILEGSFNFRDLGGYETKEGRRVKSGLLYRSGNLSGLTKNDYEIITNLGITRICDLRGQGEIRKFPDPTINNVVWHHTPILSDEKVLGHVEDNTDFIEELRNTKPGELLLQLNQNMVTFKTAFLNVFKVLLSDPYSPMLFHCMAGKDRTGAVAALILSVLGVNRDVILEDYLYTNQTLEKMNENFEKIGYNNLSGINEDVINGLIEARAEYINAFLDAIEVGYGTAENYCIEMLGLSLDDVERLKSYLLE